MIARQTFSLFIQSSVEIRYSGVLSPVNRENTVYCESRSRFVHRKVITFCQIQARLRRNDCRFRRVLNDSRTDLRVGLKRSDRCSGGGGTDRPDVQPLPEVFLEIHNDMGLSQKAKRSDAACLLGRGMRVVYTQNHGTTQSTEVGRWYRGNSKRWRSRCSRNVWRCICDSIR